MILARRTRVITETGARGYGSLLGGTRGRGWAGSATRSVVLPRVRRMRAMNPLPSSPPSSPRRTSAIAVPAPGRAGGAPPPHAPRGPPGQPPAGHLGGRRAVIVAQPHADDRLGGETDEPGI